MGKHLSKRKKRAPSLPDAGQLKPDRQPDDGGASPNSRELPPTLEGTVISSRKSRYVAQYDFNAISEDDISFKKGDKLEIDESCTQEGDWWTATNLRTGEIGFVPNNYICKDDNSPETQEWWWNITRPESVKQLLLPGASVGTFIVRPSADPKSYALSVRFEDIATKDPCVRHYKIKPLDKDGFFISPKRQFADIVILIEHYQKNGDGLCCKLGKPCPKTAPVVHFRELEVDREKVKLSVKLGHGCFGEVFKGKLHNTLDVAIKTLKPGTMTPDAFLSEAKIMHKLRHPKLVQLLAVCSDSEPIYIITELMVNGAMIDYLRNENNRKTITFAVVTDMARQIADGMVFLENHSFVHRDLRAANVLVGNNLEVKVADFGLSRILEDDEVYEARENARFPIKWTAPEAAAYRTFSVKSDIWSFGVLLYELVTLGATPYPGMTGQEVLTRVDKGYRMPKPGGQLECDDWYYDAMLQCWRTVAEDRPTFEHLYNTFNDKAAQEPVGYEERENY